MLDWKPLRGWREFVGEVGIIVLGVLIALAAQQLVENLTTQRQVKDMNARLEGEISHDLVVAYQRIAINRCLMGQIVNMRDLLVNSEGEWKGAPAHFGGDFYSDAFPLVYRTPTTQGITNAWDAARSSGLLNKAGPDLAAKYSVIFSGIDAMKAIQQSEFTDVSSLGDLAFDTHLTLEERHAHLRALAAVNNDNARIINIARGVIEAAADLGVRVPPKGKVEMLRKQRAFRGTCVEEVPLAPLENAQS